MKRPILLTLIFMQLLTEAKVFVHLGVCAPPYREESLGIQVGETILQEETKAEARFVTKTKTCITEKGTLDHIRIQIPFLPESLGRVGEDKRQIGEKIFSNPLPDQGLVLKMLQHNSPSSPAGIWGLDLQTYTTKK